VSSDRFFVVKKAAAVLKHGILSRYMVVFATKVGSTSRGGRVVILDGYAGEGRYKDGSTGSPVLIAESIRKTPAARNVEVVFVEQDKKCFETLTTVLADEASDIDFKVLRGSVEDHLDDVAGPREVVQGV
jgi:three-Cys-motif partner protein